MDTLRTGAALSSGLITRARFGREGRGGFTRRARCVLQRLYKRWDLPLRRAAFCARQINSSVEGGGGVVQIFTNVLQSPELHQDFPGCDWEVSQCASVEVAGKRYAGFVNYQRAHYSKI